MAASKKSTIGSHQHVWLKIIINETKKIMKKTNNWKTPGKDGIENYWLKNNDNILCAPFVVVAAIFIISIVKEYC